MTTTIIKAKTIKPQLVEHFDPEGNSLGMLNEFEACNLRAQICCADVEGYYLIFKDEMYDIDKNGRIENRPMDLFNQSRDSLLILLTKRKSSKEVKENV